MQEIKPTIKQLRIRKGWSVQELAFMSKISVSTAFRLDRGEYVSEVKVSKACIALGVELDDVSYPKKEK